MRIRRNTRWVLRQCFRWCNDQQALATAESTETSALANYSHARIAFDQSLGTTLDVNHISIDEALSGHVARKSVLPANLPVGPECAGAEAMRRRSKNSSSKTGMAAWKGCSTKMIALACTAMTAWAQQQEIAPQKPTGFVSCKSVLGRQRSAGPHREFDAATRSDSWGEDLSYGPGCNGAGTREQHRSRNRPLQSADSASGISSGPRREARCPAYRAARRQSQSVASGQGVAGSQQAAGVTAGGK